MEEKKIEIFTEGCQKCTSTVELVKSLMCDSCEVIVYDTKKGCESNICQDLEKKYGISKYPSVVVNGELLDCCKN